MSIAPYQRLSAYISRDVARFNELVYSREKIDTLGGLMSVRKETGRISDDLLRLVEEKHDNCVICHTAFKGNDLTYWGYDTSDNPRYTCSSCSTNLDEVAAVYAFAPRAYERPNLDTKLWRYMDFTKFVSLLQTKAIFFSRADCFEDHYEGAKGNKSNKAKWDSFYTEFFRNAISNLPDGQPSNLTAAEIDEKAEKFIKDLEELGIRAQKQTFVSCWHENDHESEAMWRLYSSFLANAVAIQTTFGSLYESLNRNPHIKIGRVKYIDYSKSFAGVNDSFWRKRKSFEHEKEVRAILVDHHATERGKPISCDLQTLIHNVFVSPQAPAWFADLVTDVSQKYGVNINASSSRLKETPFF